MTHDEERIDEQLRRAVLDADPAPEVPREEIWARIDAARRPQRAQGDDRGVIPLGPRRRAVTRHLRWAAPLAAMLLLGIAIGRLTQARDGQGSAPLARAPESPAVTDSAQQLPYRLAAVQHLLKTEALLTALPTDARAGQAVEVAGWAGDLLTDTRLLIDSPAGRDPELKRLLQDLELVLAQIAALPADGPESEVELIQDGMNQRYVMLRLRAATARSGSAAS